MTLHWADFSVPCTDADSASRLQQALLVEAADGPEGSDIVVSADRAELKIRIEAPDVSTLRAAVNSMLRLADAAQRVVAGA